MDKSYTFLVAGGGTGGHLFPALAVVEEIKMKSSNCHFHFVGRKDKLEGKVVPEHGYDFHPIEIEGLKSLFSVQNISILYKIWKSERLINHLFTEFNIQGVIATGAYISYPPCRVAIKKKIPLFLMESNVNPGKTISMLARDATILFTSFVETERFFKNKNIKQVICAGNPVRKSFFNSISKEEARIKFGLKPDIKTVLVVGGSLGSKVINQCIEKNIAEFQANDLQLLWQTGNNYQITNQFGPNVVQMNFIDDMASAYAAADIVVSRSGASALSEIALVGKPSILVPFQMGLNNEQEQNARYFERMNAAVVIMQDSIDVLLINSILNLINNPAKLKEMEICMKRLAKPNAGEIIADNILKKMDEIYS
ncbi:undecaprenyldiphospho-muramoylpentapeptide beta-N-acetylglucosaminyltransferase [bacterium]|nr:undecaprenyldiphospho-muramoylpentapeptide beta-N-acetylglucosaminyltransferase [bacterium]